MIKLVSVGNMRNSDARAIASGITGAELMRRAAEGVFNASEWNGKIAVISGEGNNGGDGYALANILVKANLNPVIFNFSDKMSVDACFYYKKCVESGIKIEKFDSATDLSRYDIIVDCIFGTGFKGRPEGLFREAIEKINAVDGTKTKVISVDINSGLNGDNGLCDTAVKSTLTVAVGDIKTGCVLNKAKDYIGKLSVADIGIKTDDEGIYLAEATDFSAVFPKRKQFSHKGTYGKTAVMGGSLYYSGAVKLANMSLFALRAGTGLAVLVVPESIVNAVSPYILESVVRTVPDDGRFMKYDERALKNALSDIQSLAFGMGLGDCPDGEKLLEYILKNIKVPVVLDADGLNILAKYSGGGKKSYAASCPLILTPHPKEFSRLSGRDVSEISDNPINAAKEYADKHGAVVLLKGTSTVITDGRVTYIVREGNAGMATGGSGDVLSGLLAGINSFSAEPHVVNAACAAYIAGKAAETTSKIINEYSMLPSDCIERVYTVINSLISNNV